jgi:hypothetical protein
MTNSGEFGFPRVAVLCASITAAIFINAPVFAQQKPMVIEVNGVSASTAKPQTTINKSGSYVLNKNIVNSSKNGADSVSVTASNVTIDLQGFSIMSTASTTGNGINATGQSNVVIRNGIIMGFGEAAIVTGNGARISGITATGNGSGIVCGNGCLARDNVLQSNSEEGLTFSDPTSGYLGNVMQGNSANTVGANGQVSGGTSLGQNVCNGVTC